MNSLINLLLLSTIAVNLKGIQKDKKELKFQKEFDEKAHQLIQYYKEKGLVIVGMNDSQGVSTNSTFWKKAFLEQIADNLTTEDFIPLVINMFSLTMNKTEHIDYFLKNNLNLEELKSSQIYSQISAIQKVLTDIGLPKKVGAILNPYVLTYRPKEKDKQIFLTESLIDCEEPIVIYSSGSNNLMRSVGNNPFGINGDYKKRNKKPNFKYTLEKSKDPVVVKGVIEGNRRNFENLLSINENTDIYTLGLYVPPALKGEGMQTFKELVIRYNEALKELCKEYQITFVDTMPIAEQYCKSRLNFHISSEGQRTLCNYILECIYNKKILGIQTNESPKKEMFNNFNYSNEGSSGVIKNIQFDIDEQQKLLLGDYGAKLSEYEFKREQLILEEHQREKEIFTKVLKKIYK